MPNGNTVKHGWILLCMCTPLYNETLRGCFTVGEKKKYQKIDDNGELVIEWKKEKSIKVMILLVGLLQIVLSLVLSSNLKKETLVERIRYQG